MANYVLEILDGDRAGEVVAVGDQPIRIGRKPGNDLVLADEKTSGVHCEIVREGDRHLLRDLGSTNGTFLDGKRVHELVLTPGDVVTVGRLRVCFRSEGEAAGASDLSMHRLDAARVGKRGGSMGLVALLLVAAGGAGGWFWWQGRAGGDGQAGPAVRHRAPLVVAGNKLAEALASCEDETGWDLRSLGGGFQSSASAHTGRAAFEAVRGEAQDAPDHAVARLDQPLQVFAGRTVVIVAHARSSGGGLAAVRGVCFAQSENPPFRFRHGTALAAADGWQRLETTVTVPAGCDRLQVELVAVLPGGEAAVAFDDVAVTEGTGQAVEIDLAEASQKALGTGSALAVRSADLENPATLLAVLPGDVPPALAALHAAGLGALSDVGATLTVAAQDAGLRFAATGLAALELVFPAEAAGSLLVRGAEARFGSVAAESEFTVDGLLLGERLTRCLVQLAEPALCRGRLGGGLYRLRVSAAAFDLVLGFRAERQEALTFLRRAQQAVATAPGSALDALRELAQTVPQDTEVLAQAAQLRADLLSAQADAVAALARDLDEAAFFDTRGGFERVVAGAEELVQRYGEHNLEGRAALRELEQQAKARLAELDAAARKAQRANLEAMAQAFRDAQQTALADLVQNYIGR